MTTPAVNDPKVALRHIFPWVQRALFVDGGNRLLLHRAVLRNDEVSMSEEELALVDGETYEPQWVQVVERLNMVLPFGDKALLSLSMSEDATTLKGEVRSLRDGQLSSRFQHDSGEILYAVADARSGRVFTGDWDGVVHIYDVASGRETTQFKHGDDAVSQLALSQDGHWLAACSASAVRVFDVAADYKEHAQFDVECSGAVAIAPNAELLAFDAGDALGLADFAGSGWLGAEQELRLPWPADARWSMLTSLCFSPDATLLLSGAAEYGTILLWESRTGRLFGTVSELKEHVLSLEFHPKGHVFSASRHDYTELNSIS